MSLAKKSYVDVINETVEYYKTHLRANSDSSCFYYINGNMCAVGRCLTKPKQVQEDGSLYPSGGNYVTDVYKLESFEFKDEYKHLLDIDFWYELQLIHDELINWVTLPTGAVLSSEGEQCVKMMIDEYKDK